MVTKEQIAQTQILINQVMIMEGLAYALILLNETDQEMVSQSIQKLTQGIKTTTKVLTTTTKWENEPNGNS